MLGKVKWFSQEKGYGFITSDEDVDHYFNVRSVKGADLPSNGDEVKFESKPGNKGLRAHDVSIVSKHETVKNHRRDDRVSCPNCRKKIVPRIIAHHGEASKSVCPYCAHTIETFTESSAGTFILFIIVIIAIGFVLG